MNKLRLLLTWGLLAIVTHILGYSITVSPIQIEAGKTTNLIINLMNTETNLTAYQMKLFLPSGVTVQKKANGKYAYTANSDRHDGEFTFTVKDAADGSVLITCFSADKDVITGTSGELIRLPIDVASTVTTSLQGSIKEIEFSDVNNQAYNISDVNFTMIMKGGETSPAINFADANVKALCVANWDTNGDGELSEAEAATVIDLGEVFKGNTSISSFNELQYFTGLTTIGNNAFDGCTSLTSIAIPNGITTIGSWAFQACENIETITLPESVKNIGGAAFAYSPKLASINLPSQLKEISDWLFTNCIALKSISIPKGVTSIMHNCFRGSGLISVTIPNGVVSIGENAFMDCSGLTSVISEIQAPFAFGNKAFSDISSNCVLTVPAGTRDAYIAAGWTTSVFKGGIVEDGSSEPERFRYYNLFITGKQGDGSVIQFSEFDLLDETLNEVEGLNVYAGTDGFSGESWPNVTDNDVHTKFCHDFNGSAYFLFDAASDICPYGYRFYTASDTKDYPERNPSTWKLYGSNTKLTSPTDPNWVLIDERNNDMTMQATNYTPYDFYIVEVSNQLTLNKQSATLLPGEDLQLQVSDRLNVIQNLTLRWTSSNKAVATVDEQGLVVAKGLGTADITVTALEDNSLSATCTVTVVADLPGHRYYQFVIEAIADGDAIQLSEFDLLDKNGIEITPLTLYAYTGSSYSSWEKQDKLFDDNVSSKYCGPFTAGTPLYLYIDAGKEVTLSGYRMTTANDTNQFPGRNPVTWSLLGSNTESEKPDDSVWMLLDRHENDNTLGAVNYTPYDFFFTYPQFDVINDETTAFNIQSEESGKTVKFTHAFNGEWEALYLPFAIDYDAIKSDFDLAEIDGIVQNDDDNDGVADFTVLSIMGFKEQMTTPNMPYLIRAKKAGMQTIVFDDVTIYPTTIQSIDCSSTSVRYEFTGSYNTLGASALTERYIVQGGELVKGATSLAPCRWYMTATARKGRLNLPAKIRIMPVEDVITGVDAPIDMAESQDIYLLDGRKVSHPMKGIYIQNGKKVVLK